MDAYWKAVDVIIERYGDSVGEQTYHDFRGMDGKHHPDLAARDAEKAKVRGQEEMYQFFVALKAYVDDPNVTNWGLAAANFAKLILR